MVHTDVENRPGQSGSGGIGVRAQRPGKAELGFLFDGIPRSLTDLIEEHMRLPAPDRELPAGDRRRILNDRLRPVDVVVLRDLLKYRRMTCSCWRDKEAAAATVGVSSRTIQMSWRRLSLHGFIEQVPVAVPDPDDPRNKTGWRITLLFAPGGQKRGSGPDRRPPLERKVWSRDGEQAPVSSPPSSGFLPPQQLSDLLPVSSAPEQPVSSEGRIPVSSKQCARGPNCSEKPEVEKSSSSRGGDPAAPPPVEAPGPDDDDSSLRQGREEAVQAARPLFGDEAKARAFIAGVAWDVERQDKNGLGGRWDCYVAALHRIARLKAPPNRNLHGYAMIAARPWVTNGIPPEPVAIAPRPKIDHEAINARRWAEIEASKIPDPRPPDGTPDDIAQYVRWVRDPQWPSFTLSAWQSLEMLAGLGNDLAAAALEELKREGARPPARPSEGG